MDIDQFRVQIFLNLQVRILDFFQQIMISGSADPQRMLIYGGNGIDIADSGQVAESDHGDFAFPLHFTETHTDDQPVNVVIRTSRSGGESGVFFADLRQNDIGFADSIFQQPESPFPVIMDSCFAHGVIISVQTLRIVFRLEQDDYVPVSAPEVLGKTLPPTWLDIQEKLPRYAECDGEIALWEGLKLPESHRHHSHLAGICPFDCGGIPEEIRKRSEQSWIAHGMGNWAGWSMPWAVMLHNRFGNAEMANLLIRIWPAVFTNKGGRTLHSPRFPGFSVIWGDDRIMQMDAGLDVVAAILDLFLYEEQGVL